MEKRIFARGVLSLLVIFILTVFYKAAGITCLFRTAFGFPCPACGMSRALISLVSGNFAGYFRCNALAVPVGFCVALNVFCRKENCAVTVITAVTAAVNFAYYIWRISGAKIP